MKVKRAILILALCMGAAIAAAAPVVAPVATEHQHCWHMANAQHAVKNHYDEVCCRCGKNVCRTTILTDLCAEHGPYAPNCVRIELPTQVVPGTGEKKKEGWRLPWRERRRWNALFNVPERPRRGQV